MNHKVTVFSTPSCGYCKMAKEFLAKNNIPYTEKNVFDDLAAREDMIARSGQYGVPVIDIDGKLIVGFERGKMKELLGL